jgi:hypothetical protein
MMIDQEDDMNGNETKYASLTAGLLARKGEAVPAAAAFTAEAIAQHIPARRLAQEAESVLLDRRPVVEPTVEETSVTWSETAGQTRASQVVSEHRNMIEQAFADAADAEEVGETSMTSVEELLEKGTEDSLAASDEVTSAMALGARRDLNLPDARPSGPGEGLEDGSALSDLNDSEENWFDTIVSQAISEAEGQRPESPVSPAELPSSSARLAQEPGPADTGPAISTFIRSLQKDRSPEISPAEAPQSPASAAPQASADTQMSAAPQRGCGDKAAKVREAIKTGKTNAASRSAMRLDPRRFIRLSLAAQKLQLSSQELMVAALDTYMDALDDEVFSDCSCMKKGLI